MGRRSILAVGLLSVALLSVALSAVACGAFPRHGPGSGASTTTSQASAVSVGMEHDGGTVSLHRGQLLAVTLDSTYWDLSVLPAAGPLVVRSRSVTPGGPGCGERTVPGSGCGVSEIVVRAELDGTAAVEGRRTTCGEALRCSAGQTSYEVGVVVTG